MRGFVIKLDSVDAILCRRGLEKGGEVQKYICGEALRLSEPYVPFLTGALIGSGRAEGEEVSWNVPYARYQYYGRVMTGRPKSATGTPLTYHGGGRRGAFWFARMKADHLDAILNGAAKLAGGRAT